MFSPERFPHARPKGKDSSPARPALLRELYPNVCVQTPYSARDVSYSFSLVRFMLYTDII